jgi:hypothetical protein
LALGLAPLAAGCAVSHVPAVGPESNPPGTRQVIDYDADCKKHDPFRLPIAIDADGHLYPAPEMCSIDPQKLAESKCCVRKCVGGSYGEERICRDFADRIQEMCNDGRPLIVLIHGFNHTYPEAYRAYKGARLRIQERYPNGQFAYLEVHWDGYYGDAFPSWPLAQVSSKWAGLGLRKLLGRVDPSIPIRILTHSRGAAVACSALWNTPMRGKADEDVRYREAQAAIVPPALPRLRAALLAPAIRPADFECYFDRGTAPLVLHDRFILGINSDDEALKAGGLDWLAGTSLGRSFEAFDQSVAPLLNRGWAHAFAVDFSGSAFHAFLDYLFRDEFVEEVLPKLLEDIPV